MRGDKLNVQNQKKRPWQWNMKMAIIKYNDGALLRMVTGRNFDKNQRNENIHVEAKYLVIPVFW